MDLVRRIALIFLIFLLMGVSAAVSAFAAYYWGKDRGASEITQTINQTHSEEIQRIEEEHEEELTEVKRKYEEEILELENEVEDLEKRLRGNSATLSP